MKCGWMRWWAAVVVIVLLSGEAQAQLFINEIFFNVGGGGSDNRDEFIELRSSADLVGTSLANHYLLIIENELETDGSGNAGLVETIFDLGGFSLGTNGFLTLRQKNSLYSVAPDTSDHVNMGGGNGYGSGDTGGFNSTIGATSINNAVHLEGGGFTAMLIRNDSGSAPTISPQMDLDSVVDNDGIPGTTNDGLDYPGMGQPGWTILDSVGIFAEPDETETGRLYGAVNFGVRYAPEDGGFPVGWAPKVEPGAEFELVEFYEAEYIGRWGNSTGSSTTDWHVSNFTDNSGAGSSGPPDWRQSCLDYADGGSCHPGEGPLPDDGDPNTPAPQPETGMESSKGVPYGTKLADTLGAPNFILGDYNKDGVVDAADYTVWRNTVGQTGSESAHPLADTNHDFRIDELDYQIWKSNFGRPGSGGGSGSVGGGVVAPEPASAILLLLGLMALAVKRR